MKITLSMIFLALLAGCTCNGSQSSCCHKSDQPVLDDKKLKTSLEQPQMNTYWSTYDSRQAWTDDKNHYHPEWREGINRPGDYPREISDHPSVGKYLGME